MPPLSTPPINKTHTWILVLLFWILAIGIFIAGYLITQNNAPKIGALSASELQSQCTTAGFVDKAVNPPLATGELEGAVTECPTPVAEQLTYNDSLFSDLSFKYFKGWQIYTMQNNTRDVTTIQLGLEPLGDCNECGGYRSPASITITKAKQSAVGSGTARIIELKAAQKIDLGTNETKILDTGTLTIITWTDNNPCDGVGCTPGVHSEWIYETSTQVITAAWYDNSTTKDDNTEWSLFLDTVKVN